jgi:uncharacterized protein (UPF0297 family)
VPLQDVLDTSLSDFAAQHSLNSTLAAKGYEPIAQGLGWQLSSALSD